MIAFLLLQWCLWRHGAEEWLETAEGTDGEQWYLRRCRKCGSLSVVAPVTAPRLLLIVAAATLGTVLVFAAAVAVWAIIEDHERGWR